MSDERPTHIDLCAGFCGFTIAAEWSGFETIGFAEIADYPSRLISARYPGRPNWGDIRNTPAVQCDLLTCGDPCQPFSVAGRRLGEADDRYLWPAVLDAIGRHNPDWCVLENVVAIKGLVLSRRFDDLEARGYQCQAFDIPSCGVGLPSVERHIWTVAARGGVEEQRLPAQGVPRVKSSIGREGHSRDNVLPPRELYRWPVSEPKILRSVKGVPNYVERTRGIGNAVPPPVAFEILRAIRTMI